MEMHSSIFSFQGYTIDDPTNSLNFHYSVGHDGRTITFIEKIFIPEFTSRKKDIPEVLLTRILDQLLILLGVSYWKLFCPKEIDTGPVKLNKEQAAFWDTVYTKGLGELFYKNNIDYRNLVQFPYIGEKAPSPISTETQDYSLVQLGGGKDSVVSSELLNKAHKGYSLVCVDAKALHRNIARTIGKPFLAVERTIDPKLYELNKQPDVYNGHVPISAMYAFIDLLVATLYGYKYIIASNEESANYGNVMYLGNEINHQWSKTMEFEKLFQDYVATYVTPSITYFSLLRPMKEIKIVELFSKHKKYFDKFSSCNTNFRRTTSPSSVQWCGKCPKCAFVFVLLSAFLSKGEILKIFGRNLYEDASLLPLFRELLGLSGIKPFECVGTPEETRLGLYLAAQNDEYVKDPLVVILRNELGSEWDKIAATKGELLNVSKHHLIPTEFQNILKIEL